jgi:hypothetical protein
MANAWIQWGDDFDCEFGVTKLDERNYSCPDAENGIHDWGGFNRSLCFCDPTGIMHTYCTECGETYEDCPEPEFGIIYK